MDSFLIVLFSGGFCSSDIAFDMAAGPYIPVFSADKESTYPIFASLGCLADPDTLNKKSVSNGFVVLENRFIIFYFGHCSFILAT